MEHIKIAISRRTVSKTGYEPIHPLKRNHKERKCRITLTFGSGSDGAALNFD